MQILGWYHREMAPLARILDSRGAPGALTRQGRLVAVAAADLLLWTDLSALRSDMLREQAGGKEGRPIEVWLLGGLSKRCLKEMKTRGIEVFYNNRERFAGIEGDAKP
jgi:hypothetical protein